MIKRIFGILRAQHSRTIQYNNNNDIFTKGVNGYDYIRRFFSLIATGKPKRISRLKEKGFIVPETQLNRFGITLDQSNYNFWWLPHLLF
jgi:hypothetical protein